MALADAAPVVEKTDWDVSIKFGQTSGTVTQLASNVEGSETAGAVLNGYAGNPIVVGLNFDVDLKLTLGIELALVGDFTNKLLAEKAFYGTVAYHLMGGSRRVKQDLGFVRFVRENPYNLSLVGKVGYTLIDVNNPELLQKISGHVFETMVGIQFRQNIGEKSAIALEFLTDMLTLPATAPQVTCKRTVILLSYRFFL